MWPLGNKMRLTHFGRFRAALLCFALFIAASASSARGAPKTFNILSWSDYFDPKILEEFASETGVRIVYDTYSSREALEARLRSNADYDVLVVPGQTLQTLIAAGALRKLDKAKLPNVSGLAPEVMARLAVFDPGNQYAAPYLWFTTGLAFDADAARTTADASFDPASWDVIFKPERVAAFADCGVSIPDNPDEAFPIALRYLGLNPASKSPSDLRRAAELLGGIRRYVKKFQSSDYVGALADGDICLAMGWSGASMQARAQARELDNGVDIGYAIPKEGTLLSVDSLVVPKDAPHGEAALAFINFLLRPEIAARNTNATQFANAVPAAQPWIAKEIIDNKAIYPDAATMSRLFAVPTPDPATQKLIAREWIRIKTGK